MKKWYKCLALAVMAGFMAGGAALPALPVSMAFAQQKQEQITSAWHVYDGGAMTIRWKLEKNSAKDKIVFLEFKSKSTERFSLGWAGDPKFILTTDQGDFATKEMTLHLTNFNRKFDMIPFNLQLTFRNTEGTAQALRITDIRPLDENGLPASGIIDLTIDLKSQR